METAARLAFLSLFTVTVSAGALCVVYASTPEFGPEGMEREHLRGRILDRRSQEVLRRLEGKRLLARDWIEGRRTLPQAAAALKQLLDPYPDYLGQLRITEKGTTEKERLCRHLMGWAMGDPEAVRRLEAELAEYLAQPGV